MWSCVSVTHFSRISTRHPSPKHEWLQYRVNYFLEISCESWVITELSGSKGRWLRCLFWRRGTRLVSAPSRSAVDRGRLGTVLRLTWSLSHLDVRSPFLPVRDPQNLRNLNWAINQNHTESDLVTVTAILQRLEQVFSEATFVLLQRFDLLNHQSGRIIAKQSSHTKKVVR
jgi:hypothetical protein